LKVANSTRTLQVRYLEIIALPIYLFMCFRLLLISNMWCWFCVSWPPSGQLLLGSLST